MGEFRASMIALDAAIERMNKAFQELDETSAGTRRAVQALVQFLPVIQAEVIGRHQRIDRVEGL